MPSGVHGEKIVAAQCSDKIPPCDVDRLSRAIPVYKNWVANLNSVLGRNLDDLITKLVWLLNDYKFFIDIDVIFDSREDFLYHQKGQLKLDNTVVEEFLPIFVKRCLEMQFGSYAFEINTQIPIFSSVSFQSNLRTQEIGGGISLKTKDQDFSISRTLYLKASHSKDFESKATKTLVTHLSYVVAELKTNLDKTMFQEASASAHDIKRAVMGAKYYLLCDFLDMTPINTATTDIDEILITRKAKRISSNVRKRYNTYMGRQSGRTDYVKYLKSHPYSVDVFRRFMHHIILKYKAEI